MMGGGGGERPVKLESGTWYEPGGERAEKGHCDVCEDCLYERPLPTRLAKT